MPLKNDCVAVDQDPCLYIVRFAHRLQFDDKTHEVSMTALRLVQRMKRDWMHTGRRPSGLCGAALLVAARLHGFNRTLEDVIKVVKVCTATLRKRLTEFGDTPSSRLTLEEFMTIDLEEEQDPPAFKAARKKAKLQQLEDQNKLDEATKEINKLQNEIERLLDEKRNKLRGIHAQYNCLNEDNSSQDIDVDKESSDAARFVEDETIDAIAEFINGTSNESSTNGTGLDVQWNSVESSDSRCDMPSKELATPRWRSPMKGLGPTAASLGLKETIEECMKVKDAPTSADNGELDLTGIDDTELDDYIMTADEVKRKSELWHLMNAEYLKELKEKEEREAKEREEGANKPEKKKRKTRKKHPIQANTAGEAIEKMLQEKKISNKINYDVLRNLNSRFNLSSTGSSVGGTNSSIENTQAAVEVVEDTAPDTVTSSKSTKDVSHVTTGKRKNDQVDSGNIPQSKKPNVEDNIEYVVENGPLTYEDDAPGALDAEDEFDEYDEEETETNEMAKLLRQHRGEEEEEYDDCGDYYD